MIAIILVYDLDIFQDFKSPRKTIFSLTRYQEVHGVVNFFLEGYLFLK